MTYYVRKKTDSIKLKLIHDEMKEITSVNTIRRILGNSLCDIANLVITNSCEMQRQCINALLSGLMQIEVSDDVVLQKNNNRKIILRNQDRFIDFLI